MMRIRVHGLLFLALPPTLSVTLNKLFHWLFVWLIFESDLGISKYFIGRLYSSIKGDRIRSAKKMYNVVNDIALMD